MSSLYDLARIDQQELDFINQLYQAPASDAESIDIDEMESAPLIECLSAAQQLEMKARFGNYTLIFFPKLVRCNQSMLPRLHLGFPLILDTDVSTRSHRVKPDSDELKVYYVGQDHVKLSVSDISVSGIALKLDYSNRVEQTVAAIELELPGLQRITVCGKVVRVVEAGEQQQHIALQYESLEQSSLEALKGYIFSKVPDLKTLYDLQAAGQLALNPVEAPLHV